MIHGLIGAIDDVLPKSHHRWCVMKLLKDREEECRNWRDEISPYAKNLLTDYREIAQGCEINFNGDFGYEVHEEVHMQGMGFDRNTIFPCHQALIYQKKNLMSEVHWWYSKEVYMLVYMHKLQPARGGKFWKVKPEHAMEPPKIHKIVDRPKLKRKRKKDEARKREGGLVNEKIKNMGEGSSQKVQDASQIKNLLKHHNRYYTMLPQNDLTLSENKI
ncbi:hypothetical protein RDI58_028439 [Solanum bulbocastanum]|uniref:Uncharacterized protein n=1 Tax=Solanum bulbocastanum TaxID=147425 RepID=A0AAN8XZ12_SOLBU